MESNVENIGALERRIELAISQDQVQEEVSNRLKKIAKKVKMDGFRPGKVPLKLVSQRYGNEVQQEVLGDALNKAFDDAVKGHDLQVVGYPRYEAKQTEDDATQFLFSAQFEVYPDIVIGDLSQQTIEKPMAQVGTEDVDKTIEMIRKQQVQYQAVDRSVVNGDRVILDFRGTLDGDEFPGGKGEDAELIVGDGKFLKDFETALISMQPDEEKSFEVTFPDDYHGKEMAGKTVLFEVKLKKVELPVLPEVNAEFAKNLGIEDGDLEKMRDGVHKDLERELSKRISAKVKEQALRCLMDTTPVDAPSVLVDKEIDRLMENARKDLSARGLSVEKLQVTPEMFKAKAEHRIKLGLVLAELLKVKELKATPEQVRKIIEGMAQSYENPEQVIQWHYASKERLHEVESLALEENVVQWVAQQVSIVEKPATFDELMGMA